MATLVGQRARVHWHLRAKRWSVSTKQDGTWKVVRDRHGDQILYKKVVMKDVKFTVQEGGRQRVLREQRKNVHAWMEGELVSASIFEGNAVVPCGERVKYNPYKYTSFVTDDEEPIVGAKFAAVGMNGVLVPRWCIARPVHQEA